MNNNLEYNRLQFQEGQTIDQCLVCLEDLKNNDSVIGHNKMHFLHEDCFNRMANHDLAKNKFTHLNCPVCREKIKVPSNLTPEIEKIKNENPSDQINDDKSILLGILSISAVAITIFSPPLGGSLVILGGLFYAADSIFPKRFEGDTSSFLYHLEHDIERA